jgi:hypothetical protein
MEMMVVKSVVTVEIGADLLMSVLEKEEMKMVALMGCCHCGGKRRSNRWRGWWSSQR